MHGAMLQDVARLGLADPVAAVRPNGKPSHPDEPMDALRRRPRHARGTLSGSTNLYKSGPYAALERATYNRHACHVAGGLRAGARLCRYVEPNVWVHHRLPSAASR